MRYKYGNMIDKLGKIDNFIITTNSYIKTTNELVMGRGIALQIKQIIPTIPKKAGKLIKHMSSYGLCRLGRISYDDYLQNGVDLTKSKILLFQVKKHFKDKADISLIKKATNLLIIEANNYPNEEFHLNFPGIGYGGLRIEAVEPIILTLPDNVFIWRFK